MHRIALVLHAHDDAVGRLRGDLQILRQALALHDERMIAGGGEFLRQSGEHALVRMAHLGELAVHEIGRTDHAAPIDLTDGLMAQANTEDRHHGAGALDQL